jgi:hypothetical protein
MSMHEMLEVAGAGAMVALVIRWVLNLSVELHWTLCIGAASLLLQSWLGLHFGMSPLSHGAPHVLGGTIVAAALLGVAQVMRDH